MQSVVATKRQARWTSSSKSCYFLPISGRCAFAPTCLLPHSYYRMDYALKQSEFHRIFHKKDDHEKQQAEQITNLTYEIRHTLGRL